MGRIMTASTVMMPIAMIMSLSPFKRATTLGIVIAAKILSKSKKRQPYILNGQPIINTVNKLDKIA